MASTFTPNIQLEEPARGDQVGTWDTPVNGNMTLVDKVAGAIATISLNNSPVVLAAAQYQSKQITFNSTLTGSVAITFPTSFTKSYEIQNICTGSSAFVITLTTTAAGGQVVCCPFGETVDCFNDGVNIKFKNIGRVGSYWDYAGSSVPAWVTGCTVPPWLNCDGTAFSAATYPTLAVILGSATLPDIRGTTKFALNQGTGRVTSSGSGLDGNTRFSVGGSEFLQSHNHTGVTGNPNQSLDHSHISGTINDAAGGSAVQSGRPSNQGSNGVTGGAAALLHTHNFTSSNTGAGAFQNIPPATISGITMIRSA